MELTDPGSSPCKLDGDDNRSERETDATDGLALHDVVTIAQGQLETFIDEHAIPTPPLLLLLPVVVVVSKSDLR